MQCQGMRACALYENHESEAKEKELYLSVSKEEARTIVVLSGEKARDDAGSCKQVWVEGEEGGHYVPCIATQCQG